MSPITLPPEAHRAAPPRTVRPRRGRGALAAWLIVIVSFGVAIALAVSWTASGRSGMHGRPGSPGSSFDSSAFGVDDGVIPDGASVGADSELPAVTRLEPVLLNALRQASAAASVDGQTIDVTSGWRSVRYQEGLFAEAVVTYGSEEAAREFVAPPTRSKHVTGEAVDLGPLDAQFWLMQYGADYGLCQTYANERWHFELATTPGGVCPEMLPDASGDWS
jgi:D-alanyl-D-alanine carboxypeptidase